MKPTPGVPRQLFTASEMSAFCEVDLKTIHNWADRGDIRHFRTPGRHLRFRRVEALDFLRRYGYPIPEELAAGKPRVYVIDEDKASLAAVKRQLSGLYEVETFEDGIDALVAIGMEPPDAVVMEAKLSSIDAVRAMGRLARLSTTQHVRLIAYAAHAGPKAKVLELGAAAFVLKPHVDAISSVLGELLGAIATT
jgi:CheY-like chemotaxis protein